MAVRPTYHYTPNANWLSDPNGLVHDGRRWHMFYQYNPHGEEWGHMSWGHATSNDLVQWQEHAPALLDDVRHMVFSGSAEIDRGNTAGLGAGAMVALYTAAATGDLPHQAQELAYSLDHGESWARHPANPVLDIGLADFRDPFVFRHEPSESWVMVVVKSTEQVAQIYRSANLLSWQLASEIEGALAPGRIWECPTLVELPLCGTGHTRWLFKVDALHDAPGAGALYRTGTFDGHAFTPDSDGWQVVDHGRDFYAAIAWNGPRDPVGRPAWIGWMGNHAYQARFPLRGWRGVMSAPRRIGLLDSPDGPRLSQQVEPGIAGRFGDFRQLGTDPVKVPVACRIELERDFAGQVTLADGLGGSFLIEARGDAWHLRRRDAGLPFLDYDAMMARPDSSGLSLWIDSETIELLSPDGTASAGFQHRPRSDMLELETDQQAAVSIASLG